MKLEPPGFQAFKAISVAAELPCKGGPSGTPGRGFRG